MHLLSPASAKATAEGVPPLSFPRICHSPRDWLHASLKTGLGASLLTHGTIEGGNVRDENGSGQLGSPQSSKCLGSSPEYRFRFAIVFLFLVYPSTTGVLIKLHFLFFSKSFVFCGGR